MQSSTNAEALDIAVSFSLESAQNHIPSANRPSAQGHYLNGTKLQDSGRLDEAAASYKQALMLNQDFIEAHINLGAVLRAGKNFAEAASCFTKALSLSPPPPLATLAHFNLGVVLRYQGIFTEARDSLEKALAIKPDFPWALFTLGLLNQEQGLTSEAISCYKKALAVTPFFPQAQTHLAILAWLAGDYEACSSHRFIVTAQTAQRLLADERKLVIAYSDFLEKLIKYRENHRDFYRETETLPVLYALGDSHCLSLANIKVNFRGRLHRIESKIIVGCKAWHLTDESHSHSKSSLHYLAKSFPPGSHVIVMFGEIDCRLDEGFLPNHKKTNADLDKDRIDHIVDNYLHNLLTIMDINKLKPIIWNVPAPVLYNIEHNQEDKQILVEIIRQFNNSISKHCGEKNIPLLDVYSSSRDESGVADGSRHLDNFHLKPSLFMPLIAGL